MDRIPFGKHKGKLFSELSTRTLDWYLENLNWLDPDLRAAIEMELERRPAVMPIGQYKGELLWKVPRRTIEWILENAFDCLTKREYFQLTAELQYRDKHGEESVDE